MFKKKKQEDEWIIGDEEFFEEEIIQEKTPPKAKKQTNKTKKQKKATQVNHESYHDSYDNTNYDFEIHNTQTQKRKPNPLRKRDNDEYSYDSYDDDIIEMEDRKPVEKWKIALPLSLIFVIFFGCIGYFNTDFDDKGQAYVIPIEIHYERKYVKESDELLELMVEINKTIDVDTQSLPEDYINISSKLGDEMAALKERTNKFSKYVGVPKKFEGYHSQIINFSISTQKLVDKLMKNYNDMNFESFRRAALEDYYNSFNNLTQAREGIDNIIFRNMGDD